MRKLIYVLVLVCSQIAHGEEAYTQALNELVNSTVVKIVNNPVLQSSVKAQNDKHATLSQTSIDDLDKKWRAESAASDKPLISNVLSNKLSKYLLQVKEESQGLFTEIFVMDNKGLNVGQSDVTSDYWQGDEAKWQKTFSVGAGAVHISDVSKDESTQEIQVQLSVAVSDVDGGAVIGAITLGINLDNL